MYAFSEYTDASAITQSLLWLPLPAPVVPIFQGKWHLNKARQGEEGNHQSEHGRGEAQSIQSLCGLVMAEGDWK